VSSKKRHALIEQWRPAANLSGCAHHRMVGCSKRVQGWSRTQVSPPPIVVPSPSCGKPWIDPAGAVKRRHIERAGQRSSLILASLLIFDLDNTVVHSQIDFSGIRRDLIALLRANGVSEPTDDALTRLSIGRIIELGEAQGRALGIEAWQIVLEYEEAGMAASTVEAAAARTLSTLRAAGNWLAVLTNNARPATLAALEKFSLSDAFDLILTRDDVPMKPDPAGLLLARERFDGRVHRAAMIGDSWLDGSAARDAGMPFIAFRPRPGVLEERGIAVWTVVDRLDQIPAVVSGPWPTP
jgi:phosphoglycolate phosphatase